ncbi:MAG: exodeoxyribonuclease VII small subunit [Clostridia bacterium]|nr:exodeoxyribonuclease VII small subunit [Clostridia bacterium]
MSEKKEIKFEEALERLENIVDMMESGEAPLDKSLELFEEGIKLVKLCTEKLDKAEQKIKIVQSAKDGSTEEIEDKV